MFVLWLLLFDVRLHMCVCCALLLTCLYCNPCVHCVCVRVHVCMVFAVLYLCASGDWQQGMRHGMGEHTYANGDVYSGETILSHSVSCFFFSFSCLLPAKYKKTQNAFLSFAREMFE